MLPARAPIASPDAEENLLSGVLIDALAGLNIAQQAGITAASFTTAPHQTLWGEIVAMTATGTLVDAATVGERMRDRMAELGGWPAFLSMTSRAPTTAQLAFYADEVAALHRRREVARHAAMLIEAAHASPDDIPAAVARLSAVAAGMVSSPEPAWPAVVAEAVEHAEAVIARAPAALAGLVSWPWPAADRAFQPLAPGELCVIAARPSVGKSSLARAFCLHAAGALGKQVLFGTLEDSPRSVAMQAAAARSGVSFTGLASAHARDQADFIAALRGLDLPNFHVFSRDNTVAAIAARARARHGVTPLDLLAIDQLSHVSDCEPSGTKENKSSAVGRVTRAAKRLAMELQIPVLLMVQLNRESAKGNDEPRLHHLRDSGEIEQDADRVVFLHRPNEDPLTGADQSASEDADDRPQFFVNALQAKGRNVGAGQVVSFYFRRKTASFTPAQKP